MSSYNGANTHNVESILASIRSTIGDEHDVRAHRPARPASAPQQHREVVAEEASEFELPAIFKPGHNSAGDARPNLLGRLSDALKPTAPPAPEPDRSRTVIRFEPASARMSEPPPPVMSAPRPNPTPYYDPASKALHENDAAPRVMTSFFDTRMKSMTSAPQPEPKPAPAPAPFQASFAPPAFASPPPFASAPPLPPALPERADAQAFGGGMEDAAAQMLRPILRQWLTENMPKIVEKALRSEAGDDFPRPIEPPRKTLR